jgi:hypothetical protein
LRAAALNISDKFRESGRDGIARGGGEYFRTVRGTGAFDFRFQRTSAGRGLCAMAS